MRCVLSFQDLGFKKCILDGEKVTGGLFFCLETHGSLSIVPIKKRKEG